MCLCLNEGSVDYIWHTNHLKLLGILSLPEPQHIRLLGTMPNKKYASGNFVCFHQVNVVKIIFRV